MEGAVVLLSGGIDSATCLAVARSEGFKPLYALSFDYGQRHLSELACAARIAHSVGASEHRTVRIDLRQFGGSSLTSETPVEKDRAWATNAEIPVTYVPARNTVFLSLALAWAETLGVANLFIGANAVDYSGYPDCRPEYLRAFEAMANLATRMGIEGRKLRIHAPLLELTKAQIITRGAALGVDYALTQSCYDPNPEGLACGHCDSCQIRRKGFREAGITDPTRYVPAAT